MPQLNDLAVSDGAIQRAEAILVDILRQDSICGSCPGYERCGKVGDAQGMFDRLDVHGGEVVVRSGHCRAYLDYVAVRRASRYNVYSSVTLNDREYSFANFPAEQKARRPKLFAAAKSFAATFQPGDTGKGFYVFGPAGVGKTHLLHAVANQLRDRRVPVIFIQAEALFDRLRSAIGEGRDIEPVLEAFSSVSVLAVDEIGQERANEFTLEKLFRIVNQRFTAQLPTLFASNYAPPDLYKRLPEHMTPIIDPLKSRLIGMSRVAYLDGDDYRLRHVEILE